MNKSKLAVFLFPVLVLVLLTGCERENETTIIYQNTEDCNKCHGGDGYILQAQGEWLNSTHASGTNVDYTNRGGSDCTQCHNHQGFLEFLETGAVSAPYDNVSAIHCFTCHAPHERGDMSLRVEDPVTLVDETVFNSGKANLCANCHRARTSPGSIGDNFNISSSHWGPHHGPQADVLANTLGYEYDDYDYEYTNHGFAVADACVLCHMGDPRQHSGYGVGGHSFNIKDDQGNDIGGVCESCHSGADGLDFLADADYDHDGTTEPYHEEMHGLMDSLHVLLMAAGTLDEGGHPIRGTVALAGVAGATWNFILVEEDQSMGLHNFNYLQGLIQSSIDYMNSIQTASPQVISSRAK